MAHLQLSQGGRLPTAGQRQCFSRSRISLSRSKGQYARARSLCLSVSDKLVLVPTGSGSADHLDSDQAVSPAGELELREGLAELGRDSTSQIWLDIPTVSSKHAMIRVEEGKVFITDLGSTNGTYIDDEELAPMKPAELPLSSSVIFGDGALAKFELQERQDADSGSASEELVSEADPEAAAEGAAEVGV